MLLFTFKRRKLAASLSIFSVEAKHVPIPFSASWLTFLIAERLVVQQLNDRVVFRWQTKAARRIAWQPDRRGSTTQNTVQKFSLIYRRRCNCRTSTRNALANKFNRSAMSAYATPCVETRFWWILTLESAMLKQINLSEPDLTRLLLISFYRGGLCNASALDPCSSQWKPTLGVWWNICR